MTSFFGVGGNPFSTPVGQKIEQATDGSLASENWALNMEICDLINETEEGPKDAIKAIRRRLQQSVGKNYTIVMFTLTVLETCVKNCGKRFHILVCNKEFISELVKLIGPKNGPPTAVQEKVLSLIQSWVDAFHQHQDLNGVVQVYQELKIKGIEFPMTDLDSMAPIHTPKKSVKCEPEGVKTPPHGDTAGIGSTDNNAVTTSSSQPLGVALTQEQLTKLKADLDIVQANMSVFGEMLNELSSPSPQQAADMELFQDLHTTLVTMQERLVELISKLSGDEITAELLRINDHLNNLFLRYGRFEKNRSAKEGAGEAGATQTDSLIDLENEATGPVSAVTEQMGNLGLSGQLASTIPSPTPLPAKTPQQTRQDAAADSDFDMFAQSRNVTYESSKAGGSTYESNSKPDQVSGNLGAAAEARAQGNQNAAAATAESVLMLHKESDFDEMAAWLAEGGGAGAGGVGGEESLTSSEFERFLAERAAAADALPTTPAASNNTTTLGAATGTSPRRTATGGKQSEAESSLFAL